jgi:hypothetical protein
VSRDFDKQRIRLEITEHIFTNSPTMLALCLTTEGLIKIYAALQKITTIADDLLIFSLAGFLLATIFSYLALRSPNLERRVRFASIADGSFIGGLAMAIVVAIFIVFTLAG